MRKSQNELQAIAAKHFDVYPDEVRLFITSDGQVFLPDNASFARSHAATHKLDVQEFHRSLIASVKAEAPAQEETDDEGDSDLLQEGLGAGVIEQKSERYYFDGEQFAHGKKAAKAELEDNEELSENVRAAIDAAQGEE